MEWRPQRYLERHYGEHCLQFGTHQSPYQDPRLPPLPRVSKVPSTQSRSRSRSRSPVARRKSSPHHSPPFRSVTPPPRHSSPSRSVTPVMDEAEAADVESGSDCNLLDLMCGWKRIEAARSPVSPVTRSPRRSDAEVQVRPADRRNNRSVTRLDAKGWSVIPLPGNG